MSSHEVVFFRFYLLVVLVTENQKKKKLMGIRLFPPIKTQTVAPFIEALVGEGELH